ncbi:MAG: hypothetical protein IT548_12045 [Alphaproteobacteria bacterium]|nr:hypothetical protein [Alphaproteobacteria bacterium]
MNLERLTAILDAYGADPLHWPQGERLAAQAFVAREKPAQALVAEAEALDAILDCAPSAAPSVALAARILARAPRRPLLGRLWTNLFPGVPVWRPALGLAAALAMGVGVQSAAADQLGITSSDEIATTGAGWAPLGSEPVAEEDVL